MSQPSDKLKSSMPVMDLQLLSEGVDLQESANSAMERRQSPREKPPQTGLRRRMFKSIDRLGDILDSSKTGRFVFIAVVVLAAILSFRAVFYRIESMDNNNALSLELAGQRATLNELMQALSLDELKSLKLRISSAESRVFPEYAALAGWLNNQSIAATQMGLNLRYTMGQSGASKMNHVIKVPIEMNVTAQTEVSRQAYLRMLGFLRNMMNDRWHLEIASASMRSDGSGVSSMVVSVVVWVRN